MDKLLERMRKLESTLGAQEVVSAIMRRSASAKGVKLPAAVLTPSLLNPDAADETAVVDAVTAISKVRLHARTYVLDAWCLLSLHCRHSPKVRVTGHCL